MVDRYSLRHQSTLKVLNKYQVRILNLLEYVRNANAMEYKRLDMFFGAIIIAFIFVNSGANAQQDEHDMCRNVADNMFLTDIRNCSKYFVCKNGQPIQQQCERNRYFNGQNQSCETSSNSCIKCGANNLSFHQFPRTCDKYIMCFSGSLILRKCAPDLVFNPEKEQCDTPTNYDCVSNQCPIESPDKQVIYIPSRASCNKYYICLNGVPVPQKCSGSLEFNPVEKYCDLKSRANCSITALSRKSRTAAVPVPPHRVNIDCPKSGVQFYPHKDPDRYYVCSNGQGALVTCGEGLFYDPSITECRGLKNFEVNRD